MVHKYFSLSLFQPDVALCPVCRYVDPVMATGWHMLLGGVPLLALSIAREGSELAPRLQQLTGASCPCYLLKLKFGCFTAQIECRSWQDCLEHLISVCILSRLECLHCTASL